MRHPSSTPHQTKCCFVRLCLVLPLQTRRTKYGIPPAVVATARCSLAIVLAKWACAAATGQATRGSSTHSPGEPRVELHTLPYQNRSSLCSMHS